MRCADREEAFTAGLLAGIGRLALAHGCPEEYARVLKGTGPDKLATEAERECFGLDYAEFGAQLIEEWGLPDVLVFAVRNQVTAAKPDAADANGQFLPWIVKVATQLAPVFARPDELRAEDRQRGRELVEDGLGLQEQSWQRVSGEIVSDFRQVAELFDARIESPESAFDLYAEAQEQAARVTLEVEREQQRVAEENRDLLRRATTDALTGIANRARFDERMREAIAAYRRGHGDFALLMLDIDHFKRFNDTYGHEVGDIVLRKVAQSLRKAVRDVDLVARYGGEEFAILAPQTNQQGACIIAARVRECVDKLYIDHNGESLHVTISAGLALTSDCSEPPGVERLLADADRQLYLSKKAGRNTWSYLGCSGPRPEMATAGGAGAQAVPAADKRSTISA